MKYGLCTSGEAILVSPRQLLFVAVVVVVLVQTCAGTLTASVQVFPSCGTRERALLRGRAERDSEENCKNKESEKKGEQLRLSTITRTTLKRERL